MHYAVWKYGTFFGREKITREVECVIESVTKSIGFHFRRGKSRRKAPLLGELIRVQFTFSPLWPPYATNLPTFFLVIHDAIVFGGRAAIKSRLSRAGRMNRLTRGRGRHPNIFQFHLSIRPIGLLIGKPKSWIAAHVSTYYVLSYFN